MSRARVLAWIGLAAAGTALLLTVVASAGSGVRPAGATARARAVKVLLAGGGGAGSRPLVVTPPLGRSGYVFPVFGVDGTADTYGSARGDVPGSWHHGDDLFAPPGTPAVAVAHGVVFSVGWNEVGGWRLWLRDDAGNEFYYAHLSAYSPLAVDGAIVQAGDVLAFVGSSGDAEGTPPHLHFEVHPVGLLSLGYDGAVDPTSYLATWRHAVHVRFDSASEWTPPAPGADAPKAGAVLLQSSDISSASGLDPASFARVLQGTPAISR